MTGHPWGPRTRGSYGIICSHTEPPELRDPSMSQMNHLCGIYSATDSWIAKPLKGIGRTHQIANWSTTITLFSRDPKGRWLFFYKADWAEVGWAWWRTTGHNLRAFPLTWETWGWGQNELWRYMCFGYDPRSTSDNEWPLQDIFPLCLFPHL